MSFIILCEICDERERFSEGDSPIGNRIDVEGLMFGTIILDSLECLRITCKNCGNGVEL